MANNALIDDEEKTELNGSADETLQTARETANDAVAEQTATPAESVPAPAPKPTYTTDEFVNHFKNGTDYTQEQLDAMSPEEWASYNKTADEYYKANPTRKMRQQKLHDRLELSDELEKKAQFVVDHTDGDKDFAKDHDEMAYCADFLKNHKTEFADFSDENVAVIKSDIEKKYKEAADRRGHLEVAWDALKKGYWSTGNMIYQGMLTTKPGELDEEDRDLAQGSMQTERDLEIENPTKMAGFQDIRSVGDAVDYVSETLLGNAPRVATEIAASTAGAIIGGPVGAMVLGSLGTMWMNTGEAVQDQLDENRDDGDIRKSRGWALLQGLGYSILDGAFGVSKWGAKLWSEMLKKASRETAKDVIENDAIRLAADVFKKGSWKELGKDLLIHGVVGEGVQEAAQSQGVGRFVRYLQTGTPLKKKEDGSYETASDVWWDAANEFVGGAVAGLGMGGASGVVSHYDAKSKVNKFSNLRGMLKEDKNFQQMRDYEKMLVVAHLINDSFLSTTDYIDSKELEKKQKSNEEIEEELDRLSKDGKTKVFGESAKAYLDIFKSNYALEDMGDVIQRDASGNFVRDENGDFVCTDGKKRRSRIDFDAMRKTGRLAEYTADVADPKDPSKTVQSTVRVHEFTNPVQGAQIKIGQVVDENDNPTGRYIFENDRDHKAPIFGKNELVCNDINEAMERAEQLDVFNQYREDKMKAKAEVARAAFGKLFGARGWNLKLVDRPTAGGLTVGTATAGANPENRTVELDIGKIDSLGKLYTTLVHERTHADIVDFLLKSKKWIKKAGAMSVKDWDKFNEDREALFATVKDENGVSAEEMSKANRSPDAIRATRKGEGGVGKGEYYSPSGDKRMSDWGRSAGRAGEEMVAERNSVRELAMQVRDAGRGLVGGFADAVRSAIGIKMALDMGINPSAILHSDVRQEMKHLFERNYFGEPASGFERKTAENPEMNVDGEQKSGFKGGVSANVPGESVNVGEDNLDASPASRVGPSQTAAPQKSSVEGIDIQRADGAIFTQTTAEDGTEAWQNMETGETVDAATATEGGYKVIGKPVETAEVPIETAPTEAKAEEAAKPAAETPAATETKNEPSETPSAPEAVSAPSEAKVETPVAEVPAKPVAAEPAKTEPAPTSEAKPAKVDKAKSVESEPVKAKPDETVTVPQNKAKPAKVKAKAETATVPANADKPTKFTPDQKKKLVKETRLSSKFYNAETQGRWLRLDELPDGTTIKAGGGTFTKVGKIAGKSESTWKDANGKTHIQSNVAHIGDFNVVDAKEEKSEPVKVNPSENVTVPQNVTPPVTADEKKETVSVPTEEKAEKAPEKKEEKKSDEQKKPHVEEKKAEKKSEKSETAEKSEPVTERKPVEKPKAEPVEADAKSEELTVLDRQIDEALSDEAFSFVNGEQKKTIKELAREHGDIDSVEKAERKGLEGYTKVTVGDRVFALAPDGHVMTGSEMGDLIAKLNGGEQSDVGKRAKSVLSMPTVSKGSIQLGDVLFRSFYGDAKNYKGLSDNQLLALAAQKDDYIALHELWDKWGDGENSILRKWFADKGVEKNDVDKWIDRAWAEVLNSLKESDVLELDAINESKILDNIKRLEEEISKSKNRDKKDDAESRNLEEGIIQGINDQIRAYTGYGEYVYAGGGVLSDYGAKQPNRQSQTNTKWREIRKEVFDQLISLQHVLGVSDDDGKFPGMSESEISKDSRIISLKEILHAIDSAPITKVRRMYRSQGLPSYGVDYLKESGSIVKSENASFNGTGKGTPLGRTVTADSFFYSIVNELWTNKEVRDRRNAEKKSRSDEVSAILKGEDAERRAREESDQAEAFFSGKTMAQIRRERADMILRSRMIPERYRKMTDAELIALAKPNGDRKADPVAISAIIDRSIGALLKQEGGKKKGFQNYLKANKRDQYESDAISDAINEITNALKEGTFSPKDGKTIEQHAQSVAFNMARRLVTKSFKRDEYHSASGDASRDQLIEMAGSKAEGALSDDYENDADAEKLGAFDTGYLGVAKDETEDRLDETVDADLREFLDKFERIERFVDNIAGHFDETGTYIPSRALTDRQSRILHALVETWRDKVSDAYVALNDAIANGAHAKTIAALRDAKRRAYKLEFNDDVIINAASKRIGMLPEVYRAKLKRLVRGIELAFEGGKVYKKRHPRGQSEFTDSGERRFDDSRLTRDERASIRDLGSGGVGSEFDEAKERLSNLKTSDIKRLLDYSSTDKYGDMRENDEELMAWCARLADEGMTDDQIAAQMEKQNLRLKNRDGSDKVGTLLDHAYVEYGWIDKRTGDESVNRNMVSKIIDQYRHSSVFRPFSEHEYVVNWLKTNGVKMDDREVMSHVTKVITGRIRPVTNGDVAKERAKKAADDAERISRLMSENGNSEEKVRDILTNEHLDAKEIESMFTHWRASDYTIDHDRIAKLLEEHEGTKIPREILRKEGLSEKRIDTMFNRYNIVEEQREREARKAEEAKKAEEFERKRNTPRPKPEGVDLKSLPMDERKELLGEKIASGASDADVLDYGVNTLGMPKFLANVTLRRARPNTSVMTDAELKARSAALPDAGVDVAKEAAKIAKEDAEEAKARKRHDFGGLSEREEKDAETVRKMVEEEKIGEGSLRDTLVSRIFEKATERRAQVLSEETKKQFLEDELLKAKERAYRMLDAWEKKKASSVGVRHHTEKSISEQKGGVILSNVDWKKANGHFSGNTEGNTEDDLSAFYVLRNGRAVEFKDPEDPEEYEDGTIEEFAGYFLDEAGYLPNKKYDVDEAYDDAIAKADEYSSRKMIALDDDLGYYETENTKKDQDKAWLYRRIAMFIKEHGDEFSPCFVKNYNYAHYHTEKSASEQKGRFRPVDDTGVFFPAQGSVNAHDLWDDMKMGHFRKRDIITTREAEHLVSDKAAFAKVVAKGEKHEPLNDIEVRALTLDIGNRLADQIAGRLDSKTAEANDETIDRLVTAVVHGLSKAGRTLRMAQVGFDLRTRDSSVYIAAQVRSQLEGQLERQYGYDKAHDAEHEKMLNDEIAKLKTRIDEMSKEMAKQHDVIDKLRKIREEKNSRADDKAIDRIVEEVEEAHKKGYEEGRQAEAEAEKSRRLAEMRQAVEKYGANRERASRGVNSANVLGDLFGASRRFAGNPSVALSDDMRMAFNDVIDMFDGDVEKARRYLSDKYEDFSSGIEPFFDRFVSDIDREEKTAGLTNEAKAKKRSQNVRKRAEKSPQKDADESMADGRFLDRAAEAAVEARDAADEEQALMHIGEAARNMFKLNVIRDKDATRDERLAELVKYMNGIVKGMDRFDVEDAKDALLGRGDFPLLTKNRAKASLESLLKAQKIAEEALRTNDRGKMLEAAKLAGIRYDEDSDLVQELERRITNVLNQKLNVLESRINEKEESNDELYGQIHTLVKAIRDIRSGRFSAAELLRDYLDLAPGMKDYRRQRSVLDGINSRIAMYRKRLENNDFESAPKREMPDTSDETKEIERANRKLEKIRERFKHERSLWKIRKLPWAERQFASVFEILGEIKALVGSFDLSSVFRQGGQMSWAHPFLMAKNVRRTFGVLKSDEAADAGMDSIYERPNAKYYRIAGLDITQYGSNAANAEDLYLLNKYRVILNNKLAKAGIEWSERGFTMFLNFMRADVFDYLVSHSPYRTAENMPVEVLRAIGEYVNVASQRGSFNSENEWAVKIKDSLPFLNSFLWSPRNIVSRLQFVANTFKLLPGFKAYGTTDSAVKRMLAKETGRYFLGVGMAIAFAKLIADLFRGDGEPPQDIVFDPRSSDFLQVRIGNTHLDFLSGLKPMFVFASRILSGTKVNSRGQKRKNNAGEALGNLLRSKFAPATSIVWDLANRENFDKQDIVYDSLWKKTDDEIAVPRYIFQNVTPLSANDVVEQFQNNGFARGMITTVLALLGVGANTYDPETFRNLKGDYQYAKRLWNDAETPEARARVELYHPMLKDRGKIEASLKSVRDYEGVIRKCSKSLEYNRSHNGDASEAKNLEKIIADYTEMLENARKVAVNAMAGFRHPDRTE